MKELDVFGGQPTNGIDALENLGAIPVGDGDAKNTSMGKEKIKPEIEEGNAVFDYDLDKFHGSVMAGRGSKDSVFVDLFGQKEYLLQLYQTLHPEDLATQEEDLKYISLSSVILKGIYNDIGFMVGDKLMILAEEQSTWTMNILPRMFIYLAHSLQDYFHATHADVYSTTKVVIPEIELYVVFTSKNAKERDVISFADEFFGKKGCPIDVRVKVLYRDGGKQSANPDIIWQYEAFARAFDVFTRKYGRIPAAVEGVLQFCMDHGILVRYLAEREKEVRRIMMDLLSQEGAFNQAIAAARAAARVEERKKAVAEMEQKHKEMEQKIEQERKEMNQRVKRNAFSLVKNGKLSLCDVPLFFPDFSTDDMKEIEEMLAK